MSRFGLKIAGLPPITGDRKIMRLLSLGDTQAVSGSRHRFRFFCNTRDFCVYFRPLTQGVPTASQVVHAAGGNAYDAYFVGSPCRVFVYERKSSDSSGRYGLRIKNAAGGVAFDNQDEPMKPLPNMFIPPLEQGGKVLLFDPSVVYQRAVNMHGNRCALAIDLWRQTYTMYRDSILLENNHLYYVFGYGTSTHPARTYDDNPIDFKNRDRFGGLSNTKPTSIGVCDTTHHHF